jgi:hypothetical protein
MVFNDTFSYIPAISFIGGGNWSASENHWQTLSHNVISSTPHHEKNYIIRHFTGIFENWIPESGTTISGFVDNNKKK